MDMTIELNISSNLNNNLTSNSDYNISTTLAETEEIPDRNIFILPWYQQLLWSLIFGIMIFVAAGGNIIVIWIVLAHKRMVSIEVTIILNALFLICIIFRFYKLS
jgi:tachykinin-like receptor